MDLSIRKYEAADRDALRACVIQLQDFIGSIDPLHRIRTGKDFDADTYLQHTMKKVNENDGTIFVAEKSTKLLGYIIGIIKHPNPDNLEGFPSTDGIVDELFVLPEYRGKGVGVLLMEKMEEYLWSHSCSVIKLNCFAPNEEAHAFYKKMGYDDRLITLIKSRQSADQEEC